MSNIRIIRDRNEDSASVLRRLASAVDHGSNVALVRTKASSLYPKTAASFFACTPVSIDGTEREGGAVTLSDDGTRTLLAYNLGTKVPPIGTALIVHSCGGRWIFRYDG